MTKCRKAVSTYQSKGHASLPVVLFYLDTLTPTYLDTAFPESSQLFIMVLTGKMKSQINLVPVFRKKQEVRNETYRNH